MTEITLPAMRLNFAPDSSEGAGSNILQAPVIAMSAKK